jgi:ribosomal protein S18 acetylase RimI-like enzyme
VTTPTTPARTESPGAATATLRPGRAQDADEAGRICHQAFRTLADTHGFPAAIATRRAATEIVSRQLRHPRFYAIVAELDGRIVGTNFLDERGTIAGIGPITVDPAAQNRGIGTRLMRNVLDRAQATGFSGVRLMQAAHNTHSLGLYATLGFDVQDTAVILRGSLVDERPPGFTVRPADPDDLDDTTRICRAVHGHDRSAEIHDAIQAGTAAVVRHGDTTVGYTTGITVAGHSVATGDPAMAALIAAATNLDEPGFLLPTSNGPLLRWALARRLRITQVMTLMTTGHYQQPRGAYLPSILY